MAEGSIPRSRGSRRRGAGALLATAALTFAAALGPVIGATHAGATGQCQLSQTCGGAPAPAGTASVTGSGTTATATHSAPSATVTPPSTTSAPGTRTRSTQHLVVTTCTVSAATGACSSYEQTPKGLPDIVPPIYFLTTRHGVPQQCALTGTAGVPGVTGTQQVSCTKLKKTHAPGTASSHTTGPIVWRYGFAGDAFQVCVHSWSVTYQGQTITQVGSPCTGRFHQTFEVGCKGTGRISASFTLAYLSSFPGWDPTVDAVGSSYGLDRVRSYPTPPGFFPDGTTTISLGSATVVPECPTAGFNTPPATESLFALGPLAAFDTGQPNLVKFEPIVRNGGHLDLPVEWIGFTNFSLGPGMDRRVPDVATTVVLDSNPYEASASVVFKPGPTDPTGSIGRIDTYFNTPSVVTAPYTLSATGTFAVYWGTEFTTLSILPNLRFATPVTLRIAGTRPVFHTFCTGTPPKRTCTRVEEQVPSSVDVSFLPLEKHGTLPNTNQVLASATTFDKTHRTVFTRSATATVKVYGPMLNVPRPGTS